MDKLLMQWTYTGNDPLASAATRLYQQRAQPCALSPYVFMTDPKRVPDVLRSAARLPSGSALIYRHFGADNKTDMARALRQICFVRNVQFLIGQDEDLARMVGADGLHLPERALARGKILRRRYPDWVLSGAAHAGYDLNSVEGIDALILSSVFTSQSESAGPPLGLKKLRRIAEKSHIPVFALGGVNPENAKTLLDCDVAGIAGVSAMSRGVL